MKKLLILTAACAILTAPATAVQKCVALNSTTTCTSEYEMYEVNSDWEATCTTNGTSVPIKGVAFCGSQNDSQGKTSDTVTTTHTSGANKNCWCRIISPAVSSWVFGYAPASAGNCAVSCALFCARSAASASAFRSAILGSLEK